MEILAILPTYNEKPNIIPLIEEIRGLDIGIDIVVVDDNSPDGTADDVEKYRETHPGVYLIKRAGKMGLGTAYVAGFKYGFERGYDAMFTMDTDFSHQPKHMPAMIKLIEDNDMVIGSRYVPGGGVRNWGIHRKILSSTANAVARSQLKLTAHDCTSGYRLYRKELLQSINLDEILSNGYSFLVEILFRCTRREIKVAESPIIFYDRERGKSKISKKEIFAAIGTIRRLRKEI